MIMSGLKPACCHQFVTASSSTSFALVINYQQNRVVILTTSPVAPMLFFPRRTQVVTIRISRAERCTSEHLSPNAERSSSFGAVIYRTYAV